MSVNYLSPKTLTVGANRETERPLGSGDAINQQPAPCRLGDDFRRSDSCFLGRLLRVICVLLLLPLCVVDVAIAQVEVEEWEDNLGETYRIKISPAAAPSPVLKYRFTVLPRDTVAGNAATHYLRSFGERSLSRPVEAAYDKYGDAFYQWQSNADVPIEELLDTPADEVSKTFDQYINHHIARATQCRHCDWGLAEEDLRGAEILDFLLPSVQETRSLSRVLALQTRVAIAEKQFDRAISLMRMNYQLAKNVNNQKFLVSGLVAIAEVGITNGTLIDMIATPDSPNMYWALTELPRPFINLREAFRMDVTMMNGLLPEIFEAEAKEMSIGAWRDFSIKIRDSGFYASMSTRGGSGQDFIEETKNIQSEATPDQLLFKAAPTILGILAYKESKQQLLKDGMNEDRVEAMPVVQVIASVMARDYNKRAHSFERWIYQPFKIACVAMRSEERALVENRPEVLMRPGEILAGLLLPAGLSVFEAQMRVQRDIDAMRVIEAIRMHAAETAGLPETLSMISVVPVPLNPATEQPFEYELKGDTAILTLPRSDGISYSKRFEIRL